MLHVGNLDARRDFLDVRDVVSAYWLALEKAEAGRVYNVCSEKAVSIREVLQMLLLFTDAEIEVRVDPDRLRPLDIPLLVGDCRRLSETTGWSPSIPLHQTLRDLLGYWRASR